VIVSDVEKRTIMVEVFGNGHLRENRTKGEMARMEREREIGIEEETDMVTRNETGNGIRIENEIENENGTENGIATGTVTVTAIAETIRIATGTVERSVKPRTVPPLQLSTRKQTTVTYPRGLTRRDIEASRTVMRDSEKGGGLQRTM
jgi:hypothetical protein